MSIVIILAAAGGSGKSTTSREFGTGEPQVFQNKEFITLQSGKQEWRKCTWTLFDNCGLTGGPKSGTDDNVSPQLVRIAMFNCLEHRDIAIIDGYMSSPQWVYAVNDHPDVTDIIIVHFALSFNELLRRISKRLGITPGELLKKRVERARGNMKRPIQVIEHFKTKCTKECHFITVSDKHSPHDIACLIDAKVCEIFQDCEE